jgi:hypothetical protein
MSKLIDKYKSGSVEAKNHLFKLVTSFLLQGMSNLLIKQNASDCKTIISSYFECDLIIDNIIKNTEIVKIKSQGSDPNVSSLAVTVIDSVPIQLLFGSNEKVI